MYIRHIALSSNQHRQSNKHTFANSPLKSNDSFRSLLGSAAARWLSPKVPSLLSPAPKRHSSARGRAEPRAGPPRGRQQPQPLQGLVFIRWTLAVVTSLLYQMLWAWTPGNSRGASGSQPRQRGGWAVPSELDAEAWERLIWFWGPGEGGRCVHVWYDREVWYRLYKLSMYS